MSEKRKWPLRDAEQVAASIHDSIRNLCTRCVIAGSIRRRKPLVGDIEILFVPTFREVSDGLFDTKMVSRADKLLDGFLSKGVIERRPNVNGHFTWGKDNKLGIHKASGIPVDFFATTEDNWWVSLMIRTGPKDWNLKLTTGAQSRGLKLNAYGCGVTDLGSGEVIRATSEQHVAELCGVPYAEPEDRR